MTASAEECSDSQYEGTTNTPGGPTVSCNDCPTGFKNPGGTGDVTNCYYTCDDVSLTNGEFGDTKYYAKDAKSTKTCTQTCAGYDRDCNFDCKAGYHRERNSGDKWSCRPDVGDAPTNCEIQGAASVHGIWNATQYRYDCYAKCDDAFYKGGGAHQTYTSYHTECAIKKCEDAVDKTDCTYAGGDVGGQLNSTDPKWSDCHCVKPTQGGGHGTYETKCSYIDYERISLNCDETALTCEAGYCVPDGLETCTLAEHGIYSPAEKTECYPCPDIQTTPKTGSESIDDCKTDIESVKFCDIVGCFKLPVNSIFRYVGGENGEPLFNYSN